MTKAKEIHKINIRNARFPKLAALDIEFQRALETSADTTSIVSKKNALRDAPANGGRSRIRENHRQAHGRWYMCSEGLRCKRR